MKKKWLTILCFVSLVSCGKESVITETTKETPSENVTESAKEYGIRLNPVEVTALHTDLQDRFLMVGANGMSSLGINGKQENSRPQFISFSWEADLPESSPTYVLQISEQTDFVNSWEYETQETQYEVYNLKVGTEYYWKVSDLKRTYTSDVASFITEGDTPRNLFIDGITNVRDIGGWFIDEHRRVRQGLAYRCGRLNESSSAALKVEITEDGIRQMNDYLGIRSEIDLRLVNDNEVGHYTQSALGEDVNYYQCPMGYCGNILENNRSMVKQIFTLLSDEKNYPVIYHCNIGTDRTGLVTYLLNGLLGVSEDDLFMDYEFSNLGVIGGTRNRSGIMTNYVSTLNSTSGTTLSQKIANYLLGIGINQIQIDTIIDLFTEEI